MPRQLDQHAAATNALRFLQDGRFERGVLRVPTKHFEGWRTSARSVKHRVKEHHVEALRRLPGEEGGRIFVPHLDATGVWALHGRQAGGDKGEERQALLEANHPACATHGPSRHQRVRRKSQSAIEHVLPWPKFAKLDEPVFLGERLQALDSQARHSRAEAHLALAVAKRHTLPFEDKQRTGARRQRTERSLRSALEKWDPPAFGGAPCQLDDALVELSAGSHRQRRDNLLASRYHL